MFVSFRSQNQRTETPIGDVIRAIASSVAADRAVTPLGVTARP
jgi:hypothetical protein